MIVGNKGKNLQILSTLGFNVPEFLVLSNQDLDGLDLVKLQEILRLKFSGNEISIRSSPKFSMPGIMDTILNVDSNDTQLVWKYINSVKESFNSKNCKLYRRVKGIPNDYPDVILQKMVYGNKNRQSGSGVWFSRDNFGNSSGMYEFKFEHQGDLIVSNQIDIHDFDILSENHRLQLIDIGKILESYFKYPVDIEFTIEDDVLYLLQVRELKIPDILTYIQILNEFIQFGLITYDHAVTLLTNHSEFNSELLILNDISTEPILIGTPINSGIYVGRIGDDILWFDTLSNDILKEITNCRALLTRQGSMTSHISLLCRNLNIPYICGIDSVSVLLNKTIAIDGSSGSIYLDTVGLTSKIGKDNLIKKLCVV